MHKYEGTEGPFETEYECIHRMREISDSLLRNHSKKEVSFTTQYNKKVWELTYKIYDRA